MKIIITDNFNKTEMVHYCVKRVKERGKSFQIIYENGMVSVLYWKPWQVWKKTK